ncbi:hypothetical protein FF125_05765 [Aureibaculum algae]|uniref:OmpA-like domain-containing protein n=1 Tax=Aureibaculum algae TaxID=2584122 RepID=A0A5B7TS02_9FLAO|nr:OmpA family protein [Aureibaculum algae]QCX37963.1 hypothetical protein FF125_05765 [Aureibaculum algae]
MKTYVNTVFGVMFFLCMTIIQAQNSDSTNDRFPFEYNERSKTTEVSLIWDKVYTNLYASFMNEDNVIILHSYSSATGKKEYNMKLSKERGNAVKKFLVNNGVEASRIKIQPHGEPNIENYDDDYAGDRNVIPEFKRRTTEKSKDFIDAFKSKETLDDDINEGHKIFLKIVNPYVTYIKNKYHLQELPGPGRPSKDVNEFLKQTKEVFDDAKGAYGDATTGDYKNLAEVVGNYGAASFIDLFTSLQAGKVAKNRKLLYDVIGEAFATECFPNYNANIEDCTIIEKFLFYSVKYKVSGLSNLKKYKLRVRFVAGKTHTMSTFPRSYRFERSMDDYSMFMANIRHYFALSDTRYKD